MKHIAPSLAALGLSALSLAVFAPATHATVVAEPPYQLQTTGSFSFTPVNTPPAGQDDTIQFVFGPGTAFAPAEVTASNFVYTGNWTVDGGAFIAGLFSNPDPYLQGHYDYTLDSNNQVSTVSLFNNGTNTDTGKTNTPTNSSITIPFSSVGTMASFDLSYYDPPSTSIFDLFEGATPLLEGSFDANGNFTVDPGFTPPSGVTYSFQPAGSPGSPSVPEPSSLALLGLGVLPLIGVARRRAARS